MNHALNLVMNHVDTGALAAVASNSVLAHQGGWDEILLVAGPIVVIVGLLALVKKRIDAHAGLAATETDDSEQGFSDGVGSNALDRGADSA
jgi:hypothetical protein